MELSFFCKIKYLLEDLTRIESEKTAYNQTGSQTRFLYFRFIETSGFKPFFKCWPNQFKHEGFQFFYEDKIFLTHWLSDLVICHIKNSIKASLCWFRKIGLQKWNYFGAKKFFQWFWVQKWMLKWNRGW